MIGVSLASEPGDCLHGAYTIGKLRVAPRRQAQPIKLIDSIHDHRSSIQDQS
jgi:hypothetical protein